MAEREAKSSDSSKPDVAKADTSAGEAKAASGDRQKKAKETRSKARSSKQAHAAVLQADLDKLEARLKRADTLTQNSVESLETIVDALETRLKTHKSSAKGQLTRQVNALSTKLEETVSETRAAIRRELREALAQGASDTRDSLAILEAAIERSSVKIDEAELAQADAITRVNRHMAEMARAVDTRIEQEARAREQDITSVHSRLEAARAELESRVGTIERDSANAFMKVGEKIEVLHEQLESRRDADTDAVAIKVKSLARQTEADFEAYRERLETRIIELETRQDMLTVRTAGKEEREAEKERDREARAALKIQLEALQNRIEEIDASRKKTEATALAAASAAAEARAQTQSLRAMPGATYAPAADTSFSLAQAGNARVAPDYSDLAPVPPSPPPPQTTDRAPEAFTTDANQGPVEFNPYEYANEAPHGPGSSNVLPFGQSAPPAAPPPMQRPPVDTELPPDHGPAGGLGAPPMGDLNAGHAPTSPQPPAFDPAPMPDRPYDNPAYAEADMSGTVDGGSPKAVRISETDAPKRRLSLPLKRAKSGSPKSGDSGMKGKALRIALLSTGVMIVGVVAGRMVLGTDSVPMPRTPNSNVAPAPNVASNDRPTDAIAGAPAPIEPETSNSDMVAPIGEYAEAEPVEIEPQQVNTLEDAVEAGDPVAEYQMGISQLENGQTARGVELVQRAANQGLPVARYRLAKLYEAGIGVEQNDVRARQLIEQAARDGNRIAMHDLALYYAEGRGGVGVNMATAQTWFEQAAQRGVLDSQYNLAVLSEAPDTGLLPEPETAYFWYSVAANQGDQFAINRRDALAQTFDSETLTVLNNRVDAFTPRQIDEQANGIFRDVPWLSSADGTAGRSGNQVRTAQSLLTELGFDVGAVDGQMGQRTRNAIIAFERDNGLPQTGRINSDLINRLERAAGA